MPPIRISFSAKLTAISLRQAYECWKAGANPIEWAKTHKEFARAFESFPGDADKLYPGWREKLGAQDAPARFDVGRLRDQEARAGEAELAQMRQMPIGGRPILR